MAVTQPFMSLILEKKMWKNMIKKFFQSQKGGDFWNLWKKEMRLYVLYLIWKYPTLTSLTLVLMRKNLTGAWSKVGATKNLSVLSQKAKITQLNSYVDPTYSSTYFSVTSRCNTVCFETSRNSLKGFKNFPRNLSKTDSADRFPFLKIFLF